MNNFVRFRIFNHAGGSKDLLMYEFDKKITTCYRVFNSGESKTSSTVRSWLSHSIPITHKEGLCILHFRGDISYG